MKPVSFLSAVLIGIGLSLDKLALITAGIFDKKISVLLKNSY
jgi:hypothetical protein